MSRLSRQEYEKDYIERANEAFATHVIADSSRNASWTIQQADGRIFYRTDILWLKRGFFLIHGDIEAVLVWTDRGTRDQRLDFIGNSDPRYIAEKAGEALRIHDVGMDRDNQVAIHDLAGMIRDRQDGGETPPQSWTDGFSNLMRDCTDANQVMRSVWEDTHDYEFSIGEVVDGRVYFAQAAARCLLRLLQEQAKASQAPESTPIK